MLKQRIALAALAFALTGAAYGAQSARDRANDQNEQAGRSAATPAADCDRLQGPERTACLAKGQGPMGAGGTSGNTATRHKQTHRSAAHKKAKASKSTKASKSSAGRPEPKPANSTEHAETATGVTSGAAPSGTAPERGASDVAR